MSQLRNKDITYIIQQISSASTPEGSQGDTAKDGPPSYRIGKDPSKPKVQDQMNSPLSSGIMIKGYGNRVPQSHFTLVNESSKTINREEFINTPLILDQVLMESSPDSKDQSKAAGRKAMAKFVLNPSQENIHTLRQSQVQDPNPEINLKLLQQSNHLNVGQSFKQLSRIESIQQLDVNFDTQPDESTKQEVRTIQLKDRIQNETTNSSRNNLQPLSNSKSKLPVVKTKLTADQNFSLKFQEHSQLLPQNSEPVNPYKLKFQKPSLNNLQFNMNQDSTAINSHSTSSIPHLIQNSNSKSNTQVSKRSLISNSLDSARDLHPQSSFFELKRLESVMKNKHNESLSSQKPQQLARQKYFNSQIIVPITKKEVNKEALQQQIQDLKRREKKFLMQPLVDGMTTEQINKKVEMLLMKQNMEKQPLKNVNTLKFDGETKAQTRVAYSKRGAKNNSLTGIHNLQGQKMKSELKTIIHDKSQLYNQQLSLPTIEEGPQALNLDLNQELNLVHDRLSIQKKMLRESKKQLEELHKNTSLSTEERNRQQREINKTIRLNSFGDRNNSQMIQEIIKQSLNDKNPIENEIQAFDQKIQNIEREQMNFSGISPVTQLERHLDMAVGTSPAPSSKMSHISDFEKQRMIKISEPTSSRPTMPLKGLDIFTMDRIEEDPTYQKSISKNHSKRELLLNDAQGISKSNGGSSLTVETTYDDIVKSLEMTLQKQQVQPVKPPEQQDYTRGKQFKLLQSDHKKPKIKQQALTKTPVQQLPLTLFNINYLNQQNKKHKKINSVEKNRLLHNSSSNESLKIVKNGPNLSMNQYIKQKSPNFNIMESGKRVKEPTDPKIAESSARLVQPVSQNPRQIDGEPRPRKTSTLEITKMQDIQNSLKKFIDSEQDRETPMGSPITRGSKENPILKSHNHNMKKYKKDKLLSDLSFEANVQSDKDMIQGWSNTHIQNQMSINKMNHQIQSIEASKAGYKKKLKDLNTKQKVNISVNIQSPLPKLEESNSRAEKKPVFQIDSRKAKEIGTAVMSPMISQMLRRSPSPDDQSAHETEIQQLESFERPTQLNFSVLDKQKQGEDSKLTSLDKKSPKTTKAKVSPPAQRVSTLLTPQKSTDPISPAIKSVIKQFQEQAESHHGRNLENPSSIPSLERLSKQMALKSIQQFELVRQKKKNAQAVSQSLNLNSMNNILNVPNNQYRKITRIPIYDQQQRQQTLEPQKSFEKIQLNPLKKAQDPRQKREKINLNNKLNFKQQIDQYNRSRAVSIQGSKFVSIHQQNPEQQIEDIENYKIERYKKNVSNARKQLRNHFDINNSLKDKDPKPSNLRKVSYEARLDNDIIMKQSNNLNDLSGDGLQQRDSVTLDVSNSRFNNDMVLYDDQLQIVSETVQGGSGNNSIVNTGAQVSQSRQRNVKVVMPSSDLQAPKIKLKQIRTQDNRLKPLNEPGITARKIGGQQVLVNDPVTNRPFKEHVRMVYTNSHLANLKLSRIPRQPQTHRNKEILSPYISLKQTQLYSPQHHINIQFPQSESYQQQTRPLATSVNQMPPIRELQNEALRYSQRIESTIQKHKDDRYRIGASKFEMEEVKFNAANQQSFLADINRQQLKFQDYSNININQIKSPKNVVIQLGQKGLFSPHSQQTSSLITEGQSPGLQPGLLMTENDLRLQSQKPNLIQIETQDLHNLVVQPQALLSPKNQNTSPNNILMQTGDGAFLNDKTNNHQTTLYSPEHNTPEQSDGFDQTRNGNLSRKQKQLIHSNQNSQNHLLKEKTKTIRATPELVQIKNQHPAITDGQATESYTFYQETLNSFRGGQINYQEQNKIQQSLNISPQKIQDNNQNSHVQKSTIDMLPLSQVQIDQASLQNLGAKSSDRSPNSFAQTLQTIGSEQGRPDEQLVWEINKQQ